MKVIVVLILLFTQIYAQEEKETWGDWLQRQGTMWLPDTAKDWYVNRLKSRNPEKLKAIKADAYVKFGAPFALPHDELNYPLIEDNKSLDDLESRYHLKLSPENQPNPSYSSSSWAIINLSPEKKYFIADYYINQLDLDYHLEQPTQGFSTSVLGSTNGGYFSVGNGKKIRIDSSELATKDGVLKYELFWLDKYEASYRDKIHQKDIFSRAKIHIALFPTKDFSLEYYPGTVLLWRGGGDLNGEKLSSPRGAIEYKEEYKKVPSAKIPNLVGLVNGTYWNEDNTFIGEGKFNFNPGNPIKGKPGGLIIDGQVVDESFNQVATFVQYNDGSFIIGNYGNEQSFTSSDKDTSKIKFLRQNNYLILENGNINPAGAYPNNWNQFQDIILRSYLGVTKDQKYFAYIWTTFTPPWMTAKILKSIDFEDVMLLDIHPVISSSMAKPHFLENPSRGFFARDLNTSFYFTPHKNDMNNSFDDYTREVLKKYQWDPREAQSGSAHDFFAIFAR